MTPSGPEGPVTVAVNASQRFFPNWSVDTGAGGQLARNTHQSGRSCE